VKGNIAMSNIGRKIRNAAGKGQLSVLKNFDVGSQDFQSVLSVAFGDAVKGLHKDVVEWLVEQEQCDLNQHGQYAAREAAIAGQDMIEFLERNGLELDTFAVDILVNAISGRDPDQQYIEWLVDSKGLGKTADLDEVVYIVEEDLEQAEMHTDVAEETRQKIEGITDYLLEYSRRAPAP